jgi:DNA (cytosine-5)-methyltransferase 1
MVFDEVQADLEAEGYEVLPFLVPACAKDAPHRRDRIWFVAYRNGTGLQKARTKQQTARAEQYGQLDGFTPHTDSKRCDNGFDNRSERPIHNNEERNASKGESERSERERGIREVCGDGDATHTESSSGGRQLLKRQGQGQFGGCDSADNAANANSRRQPSKEHGQKESGRLTKTSVRGDWQNFPTQSPICGGDDRLPSELDGITFPKWRNESIKAYGNAVVPQVVYEIFKAIESYSRQPHGGGL